MTNEECINEIKNMTDEQLLVEWNKLDLETEDFEDARSCAIYNEMYERDLI